MQTIFEEMHEFQGSSTKMNETSLPTKIRRILFENPGAHSKSIVPADAKFRLTIARGTLQDFVRNFLS